MASRSATPSSSGSPTLVASSDDLKSLTCLPKTPSQLTSASDLIEFIASRASVSSAVYVYDVAEQVGFGTLTKSWAAHLKRSAPVIPLQTRAGAGLSLVGRLSQGSSQDAINGSILTAYTTPVGLAAMAASLTHLPPPSSRSRLIVQVPAVTPVGDTFALSPTLASLSTSFSIFPDSLAVILSATPQESVDLALLAYKLKNWHVAHIFDHHSAARELGHHLVSNYPSDTSYLPVSEAVRMAGYSSFEFAGDKRARTVFVLLNGQLALIAKALASRTVGVAVVIVRVLRPWGADELQKVIPSTAEEIYVFDDVPQQATRGPLFADVFSSLYDPTRSGPMIRAQRITPDKGKEFISDPTQFCSHLASFFPHSPAEISLENAWTKLVFLSTPSNQLTLFHQLIADTYSRGIAMRRLTDYDVFSKAGGITADRIILSHNKDDVNFLPISLALPLNGTGLMDFTCIIESHLLKSHSILDCAKPGSAVLVITSWSSAELLENLPPQALELALQRKLRLYTIDAKAIASELCTDTATRETAEGLIIYLTFLRLYLGKMSNQAVVSRFALELVPAELRSIFSKTNALDTATSAVPTLRRFEFNTIAVDAGSGQTVYNGAKVSSWHEAAKHLLFPSVFTPLLPAPPETEEFPQIPSLHPELAERTYLVTCTVNRRLTPLDYDRNVFHLEFDTEGTGLKYAIGEALGIHGWNDTEEVLNFCAWYGVDPDRVITIPAQGGEKMHSRTIFQALQQQIDLFGEPPKSFYTELAPYATEPAEKHALQFIGSSEGSSTFKKLNEKDTITFAQVLQRYRSARPGIETLCELIGDIKPRHYSIASAQSVVGDRVDLLVVTVEWADPSGKPHYGQCTRYLAGLKPGQQVTVSIKPSVMKLPPDDTQPIIMAGLGTGAAPFRAFLQHRAWLSQQGCKVGPTYYYFGSRHQHQEYLYGEEIQAYILDEVITKAGLAFSRDGPKKVYIQHKMLEDAGVLADMLKNRVGVFYLCGPTWPVPDVYEALVGALVKNEDMTRESAGQFIESLKEEERYVLEVTLPVFACDDSLTPAR
ncbi:assimilatory sulfite reductase [Boletus edulis BED1]|uniref:assimilatory sulfite reductase (NADPH) n=1 Tax=Boletus edulis BED1 TaxID=1328754 RepID=A0AAD4GK79_BOLED|nr:assimilatory sulfite reductase [Boletus edulis BED1]